MQKRKLGASSAFWLEPHLAWGVDSCLLPCLSLISQSMVANEVIQMRKSAWTWTVVNTGTGMFSLCILWNHQHVVVSYEDQEITRTPGRNNRHWIPEKLTEHHIYGIAGKSPQQQSSSSQIAFHRASRWISAFQEIDSDAKAKLMIAANWLCMCRYVIVHYLPLSTMFLILWMREIML